MRFRFERLKRLGPITSSITAARLRVFTQPRPICDIGRAVFGLLNNVAVIPALAKVNRLSIEMRSEAAYVLRENSVAGGSIAIPRQSLTQNELYDCEHMVFNPWNCLPEHTARQRQPDAACRLSCLAASTAVTEHGGS